MMLAMMMMMMMMVIGISSGKNKVVREGQSAITSCPPCHICAQASGWRQPLYLSVTNVASIFRAIAHSYLPINFRFSTIIQLISLKSNGFLSRPSIYLQCPSFGLIEAQLQPNSTKHCTGRQHMWPMSKTLSKCWHPRPGLFSSLDCVLCSLYQGMNFKICALE